MPVRMQIDDGYASALSAAGLSDFESVMRTDAGVPVSVHGDRDALRLDLPVNGTHRAIYIKRTFRQSLASVLRDLATGRRPLARPVHEYQVCKRLAASGVRVMRAVGFGEERWCGLPGRGFLLAEAVPGEITLERAWQNRVDGTPRRAPAEKRAVTRAVARAIARMHDAGFRWPDMVSKHIVLEPPASPTCPDASWSVHLIDLERTHASGCPKAAARGLAALWASMPAGSVSRTDLLRFAVSYCGCEDRPWRERRAAVRERLGNVVIS